MRLLNTKTHLIEKFDDPSDAPRSGYAILSHTWILKPDKELELDEIRSAPTDAAKASLVKGHPKTRETCKLAQAQTPVLSHVWIDTICIDQNSSSDKSEAINAMYRYYQDAKMCFTHLFDVDGRGMALTDPDPRKPDTDDMKAVRKEFSEARWFKRGWTLQELLAPPQLFFYDKNWKLLGSRSSLCNTIAGITRIELRVLQDAQLMWDCSIAQRMSWAAGRKTRRPEDKAYSLMGIFGVNMPMIYGEGDRAFIRLQEEIIKVSDDHSLFAWSMSRDPNNSALLARSPDPFEGCTNITRQLLHTGNYPYSVTNRGISMQLSLAPFIPDVFIAPINCIRQPKQPPSGGQRSKPLQLGLFLKRDVEDDKYIRVAVDGNDFYEFPPGESLRPRRLYGGIGFYNADTSVDSRGAVSLHVQRIPNQPNVASPGAVLINGFKIGPNLWKGCQDRPWKSVPDSQWDATTQILSFAPRHLPSLEATLKVSILKHGFARYPRRIMVYFDESYNLICDLNTETLTYFDAYKKKKVQSKAFSSAREPLDLAGGRTLHTYGDFMRPEVDRFDGLDAYFPAYIARKEKGYLHVMLQRELVSGSVQAQVWAIEVEAVQTFEDNPWAETGFDFLLL
ncbi:hypothetical protein CLAIMM_14006 [Cladophialophora immunda]|nr:hypothetical protein CLAIMM_14006 [Cladophialophora immunda]